MMDMTSREHGTHDMATAILNHSSSFSSYIGETTQLGDPKPAGGGKSEGESGGQQQEGPSGSSSAHNDPRSESPLADRTGYYAGMGALVGAVLGWASQFF